VIPEPVKSPSHERLLAGLGWKIGKLTAWVLVGSLLVAGVSIGVHRWQSRSEPSGVLAYQNAGVSEYGPYLVGVPYSVSTPPLVNIGRAPLTLEGIQLLTTGCSVKIESTSFLHFKGEGIQAGPGDAPRSQWSPYNGTTRAGLLQGRVLLPARYFSPSFKEIFTLGITDPGAFGVLGYKVTYRTGGQLHTEVLRVPQVLLPIKTIDLTPQQSQRLNVHAAALVSHVSGGGILRDFSCSMRFPTDVQ
jgi:hypothetical protein